MNGETITYDGQAYRVVLTHKSIRGEDGTRGLPVTAIRTEGGELVPGLENMVSFMLDAEAAKAGTVKVLAKR